MAAEGQTTWDLTNIFQFRCFNGMVTCTSHGSDTFASSFAQVSLNFIPAAQDAIFPRLRKSTTNHILRTGILLVITICVLALSLLALHITPFGGPQALVPISRIQRNISRCLNFSSGCTPFCPPNEI